MMMTFDGFFFTCTKETQSRDFAIAFVPMKIYLLCSELHDGNVITPSKLKINMKNVLYLSKNCIHI